MNRLAKTGYGIGQFADGIKQAAFNTFLFFYYNQVLGLSGTLAGTAALLALLIDAVTDPMVGQLSDSWRSRWGRRHPFMLLGIIPFGIAIVTLFNPPAGLSEQMLFVWMFVGSAATRVALTFFSVPHLSLGAELLSGYHARTSLVGYRVFFTYAGIVIGSVVGFTVFFPSTQEYANGLLNAASYPNFALFCAAAGMIAMVVSFVATLSAGKRVGNLVVQPRAQPTNKRYAVFALAAMVKLLRQKSFRVTVVVTVLVSALAGTIQALLVYLSTFVFGFSPDQLAGLASSVVIGVLLASPVAQYIARRFDKKQALAIIMVCACVFAFAPTWLFLAGILPNIELSTRFVVVFLLNGISQIFFIAYIIILDSMLTDTIDENELNTGKREEGLFFAARAFAGKASYGLGIFIAGVGMDVIQFPQNATPENVPAEAITSLAIFAGPVLMLAFLLVILISRRYPLTEQMHAQIVAEIAGRKQGNSSATIQ